MSANSDYIYSNYTSDIESDEKPSQDKISLIFDLDETFITSVNTNIHNPVYMSLGPHRMFTLNYTTKWDGMDHKNNEIIAVRPGFIQFKEFLLANLKYFNIGFWSTGDYNRVKAVVDTLFPELIANKQVVILIGRDEKDYPVKGYIKARDSESVSWKIRNVYSNRVFYDLLSHKHLKFDGYLNGNIVKRVDLLCDLPDYRDILHKKRTILIDDLTNNIIVNDSHNTIWVNEWGYNFTCDDTLPKLQKWLDKNKYRKSFEKVKMPNYARDSKFNTVFTRNSIEYATASQKVCDAFYKKEVPASKHVTAIKHATNGDKSKKSKKAKQATHKLITHKLKKKLSGKTKKVTAK